MWNEATAVTVSGHDHAGQRDLSLGVSVKSLGGLRFILGSGNELERTNHFLCC